MSDTGQRKISTKIRAAEDETVFTPEQAAEYLKVPAKRLDFWRWNGRGPTYFRIGKSPRYTKAALNEYIRCQAIVPLAPASTEKFYGLVSQGR